MVHTVIIHTVFKAIPPDIKHRTYSAALFSVGGKIMAVKIW
jgi:hypothetical protein